MSYITYKGYEINLKEEDDILFKKISDDISSDIKSLSFIKRVTNSFWSIFLISTTLFTIHYLLGIVFILYLFTDHYANLIAKLNTEDSFSVHLVSKKIQKIKLFNTNNGIEIIKNLGSISVEDYENDSEELELQAQIEAYNKRGNAIIGISINSNSIISVSSKFRGIGVSPGISSKSTIIKDLNADIILMNEDINEEKLIEEDIKKDIKYSLSIIVIDITLFIFRAFNRAFSR